MATCEGRDVPMVDLWINHGGEEFQFQLSFQFHCRDILGTVIDFFRLYKKKQIHFFYFIFEVQAHIIFIM